MRELDNRPVAEIYAYYEARIEALERAKHEYEKQAAILKARIRELEDPNANLGAVAE